MWQLSFVCKRMSFIFCTPINRNNSLLFVIKFAMNSDLISYNTYVFTTICLTSLKLASYRKDSSWDCLIWKLAGHEKNLLTSNAKRRTLFKDFQINESIETNFKEIWTKLLFGTIVFNLLKTSRRTKIILTYAKSH